MIAIVGTLAICAVLVAVGLWVDKRVPLLPRPETLAKGPEKKELHAAGAAPHTAIAGGAAEVARTVAGQKHGCKLPPLRPRLERVDDERVRYGGKELLLVRLRCPACGATESLYFDVSS